MSVSNISKTYIQQTFYWNQH